MDILFAKGLDEFNYLERKLAEAPITSLTKRLRSVLRDVGENLYLILLSMIPLIFLPFFQHGFDCRIDIINGIFNNPDMMLLSIPYIMHGVLLVAETDNVWEKELLIGWCSLLIILSILVYLLLKLGSICVCWIRISIIWTFLGMTIISAIWGSLVAYLHKKEES